MYRILRIILFLAVLSQFPTIPALAQAPPPPTEKVEKPEPAQVPAAPPAKYERDGGSMVVPYLLAILGIGAVLALICLPVRRE